MTKTATVRAQQKWEYLAVNRKVEEFLVAELNEVGKAGWELVTILYTKDIKGVAASFSWTAFLKRPLVEQQPAAATSTEATAVEPPPRQGITKIEADETSEVFDLRS